MQEIIITKNEANKRLDKLLFQKLPNASKGLLYKMLRKKNITLNNKKADGSELLTEGDHIKCFFAEETFHLFCLNEKEADSQIESYLKAYKKLSKDYDIKVVLETPDVIIINKPVGILSQKAEPMDVSVNEWLLGYLLHKETISKESLSTFHPSICNRLDRNTSGLMICSKTLPGSQKMSELIKDRNVHKYYRTIVKGRVEEAVTLEGYIYKNEQTNKVTISEKMVLDSEPIKTSYVPIISTDKFSYVEVELFTGKTHQIRAHLASISHPIAGDIKYGSDIFNDFMRKTYGIRCQLLHAYRLEFPTLSGSCEELSKEVIYADLPAKFETVIHDMK